MFRIAIVDLHYTRIWLLFRWIFQSRLPFERDAIRMYIYICMETSQSISIGQIEFRSVPTIFGYISVLHILPRMSDLHLLRKRKLAEDKKKESRATLNARWKISTVSAPLLSFSLFLSFPLYQKKTAPEFTPWNARRRDLLAQTHNLST